MDMSHKKRSNSFVFLNMNTTGRAFQEDDGGKTKITEICFVSVPRQTLTKVHLHSDSLPKSTQKLSFTVNPGKMISDDIIKITGLDNFTLQEMGQFDDKMAQLIKIFLRLQEPPITIVSHRGYHLNFPLLKEELIKFEDVIPQNTRCGDTFYAFKELSFLPEVTEKLTFNPYLQKIDFDMIEAEKSINVADVDLKQKRLLNETTPESQKFSSVPNPRNIKKRKLTFQNEGQGETNGSVTNNISVSLAYSYQQMFGTMPLRSHRAEDDTVTMVRCCLKFGQPILDWLDKNSVPYDNIPPLYSR